MSRGDGNSPYAGLPDHRFWRRAVAEVEPFALDPVTAARFTIGRDERVATAGSCFAQHIARRLAAEGFHHFVTEDGADRPADEREALGYGVFSARYGNLYTARQLLLLFRECFDGHVPQEVVWRTDDGRFVDALRPRIVPGGFATADEVLAARAAHLPHVRRMFAECDVFVFTLGLTEAWRSRLDGTVYPIAPGVAGGSFNPVRHEFVNFRAAEVAADLDAFIAGLQAVNPAVRVLLTVSPVPLVATYEPRHVLVSTTVSKAALRVAADEACRAHDRTDYFPSYEIITGNFNDGRYYEADYRGINELGVDHAMRCFLRHYTRDGLAPAAPSRYAAPTVVQDIVCDEEAIDQIRS